MILSMSGQAWLFLFTVITGFVIGFIYDIFRILRKTIPHSYLMVQLEDILYWICVSLLMFYFMLHRNYGEIRLFSIAGAALGGVLYFLTLSPVIIKVSVAVIGFFKRIILFLLDPIKWFCKILLKGVRAIKQKTKRKVRLIFYIPFWALIVGAFVGLALMQYSRYEEYRLELNRLIAETEQARQVEANLRYQQAFYESDAFIEQLARERLNFVRQDEIIFVNTAE